MLKERRQAAAGDVTVLIYGSADDGAAVFRNQTG